MINNERLKNEILNISNDQYKLYSSLKNGEVLIGKQGNKCCFIVRGSTKRLVFKSTSIVRLELTKKGDNRNLYFILQDTSFLDVFVKLLDDITQDLTNANGSTIDNAYKRFLVWKSLFGTEKRNILSEEQIRGLIGELYIMKSYLFNKYDTVKSVSAWGGPEYNKKDFEIENTWYEVKTTIKNPGEVEITSLEQLASNTVGYLSVVNLEKSTPENELAVNLNKMILECTELLDPDTVDKFVKKLSSVGYQYNEDYFEHCYNIKETTFYKVENQFPRLTPKNVPFGVTKCIYTLSQDLLVNYQVNFEEI